MVGTGHLSGTGANHLVGAGADHVAHRLVEGLACCMNCRQHFRAILMKVSLAMSWMPDLALVRGQMLLQVRWDRMPAAQVTMSASMEPSIS